MMRDTFIRDGGERGKEGVLFSTMCKRIRGVRELMMRNAWILLISI